MSDKPSYIGLLNAISNGERRGHELLSAWAQKTPDPALRAALNVVAIREAEHAWAFEKRLCELGFGLRYKDDPKHAERMACACSDGTDVEKMAFLRAARDPAAEQTDDLLPLLADRSIDPQTAGLLGRFIAEERDSGRRLDQACADVHRRAEQAASMGSSTMSSASMSNAASGDVLTEICRQLAALHEKVEALSSGNAVRKLEAVR